MDKEEYIGWRSIALTNPRAWKIDPVSLANGRALFHYGKPDGVYVMIEETGEASFGYFEDALPHIGEATFTELRRAKLGKSLASALPEALKRLELPFLLSLVEKELREAFSSSLT